LASADERIEERRQARMPGVVTKPRRAEVRDGDHAQVTGYKWLMGQIARRGGLPYIYVSRRAQPLPSIGTSVGTNDVAEEMDRVRG